MPRAASAKSSSSSQGHVNSLRRNQACHRCRKRKLKCDALSPCGPCIKSHAHALKQYPTLTPSEAECTYDDPEEVSETSLKAKIARQESHIADLLDIIAQKDAELSLCTCRGLSNSFVPGQTPVLRLDPVADSPLPYNSTNYNGTTQETILPLGAGPRPPGSPWGSASYSPSSSDFQLNCSAWPLNIPPPDVLHHLVETFFASVPLADRLIHRPTFMANLQQAPSSPEFPHVALLHAICGKASLYTSIIRDELLDNRFQSQGTRSFNSGVIPSKGHEQGPRYFPRRFEDTMAEEITGFGAVHIRWAASSLLLSLYNGDRLLQLLQADIICAWYCHSSGRPLDTYRWLGGASRMLGPLGIWTSPGFEPLSRLPPAQLVLLAPSGADIVEGELRRNVFWISYAMERTYMAGTVWPLFTRDEECSQLMPCRLSDFMACTYVPTRGRQQICTPNMLITHPPLATDSFTLYIKASMLLGRVKTFNIRYKSIHALDQSDSTLPPLDPRTTTEFQTLDSIISGFLDTFPRAFKDPVGSKNGSKLDPVLYMAHLLPHVSMITLHDPHADVSSTTCPSAKKLLAAARAIFELIYKISATSYDLLYLEHAGSFCWFLAGATIIRFLKVKMDAGDAIEVDRMTQELAVVRFMLSNMGDRTLIGLQQIKLLTDIYQVEIGERQPREL